MSPLPKKVMDFFIDIRILFLKLSAKARRQRIFGAISSRMIPILCRPCPLGQAGVLTDGIGDGNRHFLYFSRNDFLKPSAKARRQRIFGAISSRMIPILCRPCPLGQAGVLTDGIGDGNRHFLYFSRNDFLKPSAKARRQRIFGAISNRMIPILCRRF